MDNEHDNLFFYSLNEINKLYIHFILNLSDINFKESSILLLKY
jgi:hypothetical protein